MIFKMDQETIDFYMINQGRKAPAAEKGIMALR